jgi:hypothetical protein
MWLLTVLNKVQKTEHVITTLDMAYNSRRGAKILRKT